MVVVNQNKNKHWKTTCRPVWKATDCCLADTLLPLLNAKRSYFGWRRLKCELRTCWLWMKTAEIIRVQDKSEHELFQPSVCQSKNHQKTLRRQLILTRMKIFCLFSLSMNKNVLVRLIVLLFLCRNVTVV